MALLGLKIFFAFSSVEANFTAIGTDNSKPSQYILSASQNNSTTDVSYTITDANNQTFQYDFNVNAFIDDFINNYQVLIGRRSFKVDFINLSVGSDSYEWDFDNDSIIDSTLESPTKIYTQKGNYFVKLKSIDNSSGVYKENSNFLVIVLEDYPIPNFQADRLIGNFPLPVNFTNLSSIKSEILESEWTVFDKEENNTPIDNVARVEDLFYTFNYPGRYNISLRVKNSTASNKIIKKQYIEVLNPITLTVTPQNIYQICTNENYFYTVTFNNVPQNFNILDYTRQWEEPTNSGALLSFSNNNLTVFVDNDSIDSNKVFKFTFAKNTPYEKSIECYFYSILSSPFPNTPVTSSKVNINQNLYLNIQTNSQTYFPSINNTNNLNLYAFNWGTYTTKNLQIKDIQVQATNDLSNWQILSIIPDLKSFSFLNAYNSGYRYFRLLLTYKKVSKGYYSNIIDLQYKLNENIVNESFPNTNASTTSKIKTANFLIRKQTINLYGPLFDIFPNTNFLTASKVKTANFLITKIDRIVIGG